MIYSKFRLETPGPDKSEFLWLDKVLITGVFPDLPNPKHLVLSGRIVSKEEVYKLIKHLQAWLDTGSMQLVDSDVTIGCDDLPISSREKQ